MYTEKEYQLIFTSRARRPFVAPTAQALNEMACDTQCMCQVVQFRAADLDEQAIIHAVAKGLGLQEYALDPKDFCNTQNGYMIYTMLQDAQGRPLTDELETTSIYVADYTFYVRELVPVDLERLQVFTACQV